MIKTVIICCLSFVLFSGCATNDIIVVSKPKIPFVPITPPSPIVLEKPEVIVLNSNTIKELNIEIANKKRDNIVLYGFSENDFNKILENYVKISAFMLQKQAELDYYKTYISSLSENNQNK